MAQHNKGYITGSIVSAFLTGKDPAKPLVGTYSACAEIVSERLEIRGICESDPDFDEFSGSKETEYGNMYEADAIMRYEQEKFCDVHSQQVQVYYGKNLSCTPDGLIDADGLLEVKTVTKIKAWVKPDLIEEKLKQHNDQIQFNLMLTDREWCDLVLYMPRFKQPYDMLIHRVQASQEWREFAKVRLEVCNAIINEMEQQFLNKPQQ